MARPEVGGLAEETYQDVDFLAFQDEENAWPLLTLLGALLDRVQDIADLARESDTHPGWGKVVDPDEAPEDWLPWTAQLVGVEIPPPGSPDYSELSEAAKRLRIKETAGMRRGTRAAIEGAARQYLIGPDGTPETATVEITERHGGAYRLTVVTLDDETPDPAAVEAAILAQKPAGILLNWEDPLPPAGDSWDDVEATHAGGWTEVAADFTDWSQVMTDPTHT